MHKVILSSYYVGLIKNDLLTHINCCLICKLFSIALFKLFFYKPKATIHLWELVNREMISCNDHHYIFTHWQSITFSCTMVWLFISPDHCIVFHTLLRIFSLVNQLNPFIFNKYMADYIHPFFLLRCDLTKLMLPLTLICKMGDATLHKLCLLHSTLSVCLSLCLYVSLSLSLSLSLSIYIYI